MTTIELDRYVLDVLLRDLTGHERAPSAFLVYLYLWSRTLARNTKSVRLSLRQLAEGTGLSKSAVQSAIHRLLRRRLIGVKKESRTAVPDYSLHRPWASRKQPN